MNAGGYRRVAVAVRKRAERRLTFALWADRLADILAGVADRHAMEAERDRHWATVMDLAAEAGK